MKIKVFDTPVELGKAAAIESAEIINRMIAKKGKARIILSTGASQFDTIIALVKTNVDWSKVEMFHLDEYIDLPESHPASFRKYLKERFLDEVNIGKAYLVDGESNPEETIANLTHELRKEPIDLGLIGIGENAHIAFNDPPADFDTRDAYIRVKLNDACKRQQVREGWFATVSDVPAQAISMTVYQIMQCRHIISCVPYGIKANAIKSMLESSLTNLVPATILKEHAQTTVYLDKDSASLANLSMYLQ
jgi:glucosamine-6-phosphate deaminase